jgi:hypothetical protein
MFGQDATQNHCLNRNYKSYPHPSLTWPNHGPGLTRKLKLLTHGMEWRRGRGRVGNVLHHTSMTSSKRLSDTWTIHMRHTPYHIWSTIWFQGRPRGSRSTTWFKVNTRTQPNLFYWPEQEKVIEVFGWSWNSCEHCTAHRLQVLDNLCTNI